ncbi:MAG: YbhB/YbcL family Raf kinase inhibitor-like protein [Snowella sp.]|nr:YbhB/YbcL family Raf kinase inhibitor-like protein [Snowella sp.]
MKLISSAFEQATLIPKKYTCDGYNISPPLSWSETPEGTQSFVLIMDDPDAAQVIGTTFDHWVLYDLPGHLNHLTTGLPSDPILENGGIHGLHTRLETGYRGPCPPPGAPHHYYFQLFALDCFLTLEPGKTKAEILQAMQGHILAQAELMGLYQR